MMYVFFIMYAWGHCLLNPSPLCFAHTRLTIGVTFPALNYINFFPLSQLSLIIHGVP